MQSVTSMFDCTHGPKKDCHACLVVEMAGLLKMYITCDQQRPGSDIREAITRAVLKKAKLIEDCIPLDEAEEASRT